MQVADRIHSVPEYYFSQKMHALHLLEKEGKKIVNMGIGNPDLPPPEAVVRALQKASTAISKHGYQPYKGIAELRLAIAAFYSKQYTVNLNPETEILPLAGSKEGIMHISMAFLNPQDKVLIPNPGYAAYSNVTNLLGAQPVYYDLIEDTNWQPDWEALEQKDLSNVKIMWVNYPNMPTGAKAEIQLFEKLVHFAKKNQILLVNDNPYSFILTEKPLSILSVQGSKEVVLELNSLSKSFNMAGWRIGMLCGSQEHIQAVLKVKSNMDSGMYYGLQAGAIAALNQDDTWFKKLNKIYFERRKIVYQIIDRLGGSYQNNSVGFFVWAQFPTTKNSVQWSDYLLEEKGIFVTPGSIFGSNGEGYLRFSLCVNTTELTAILNRL